MGILLWPTGGRRPFCMRSCSDAGGRIVKVVELWRVDLKPNQGPILIILLILMLTKEGRRMWILLCPSRGAASLLYALSCSDAESGIVQVVELWRVDLKPNQDPILIILLILMLTKECRRMWILLWPTQGRHPLIYALSCSDVESGIVQVVELRRVALKPNQGPILIILLILMLTKKAGGWGFSCGLQGGAVPSVCPLLLGCGKWNCPSC